MLSLNEELDMEEAIKNDMLSEFENVSKISMWSQDIKYAVQESEAIEQEDTVSEDTTENPFKAPMPLRSQQQSTILISAESPISNVSKLRWKKRSPESDSTGSADEVRKRPLEMSKDKSQAQER